MGSTVSRNMIDDVTAFHRRFGCHIGDYAAPKIFNGEFRAKFLIEETGETARALDAEDAVEIIDGLCDTIYVAIGSGIEFGIDLSYVPFEHIDEPAPSMELIDNKRTWAAQIETVGELAAHVIREGRSIDVVRGELESVLRTCNAALLTWGLDVRPFWDEVQRANMEKVPSGSIDVKTIKPKGWRGPNHTPILLKQYGLAGVVATRTEIAR